MPALENRPPIWLLGSSVASAQLAGAMGLPYAFAHQIKPDVSVAALQAYRNSFRPSTRLRAPYALIAAVVITGESDEDARRLAALYLLGQILHRSTGRLDPFPTPEEAERHEYSAAELEFIRMRIATQVVGGPATIRDRMSQLLASTGADELMALTLTYEHADRVHSYELLAEAAAWMCGSPN